MTDRKRWSSALEDLQQEREEEEEEEEEVRWKGGRSRRRRKEVSDRQEQMEAQGWRILNRWL